MLPYPPQRLFEAFARPELLSRWWGPSGFTNTFVQHVSQPRFVLTVTLAAHEAGTAVTWAQEFEDSAVAARIRHIVEPANEQNLDRLQSVLAGGDA